MTPRKPPRKPWETFPSFAHWAEEQTPKDDPDGLRGVRTAAALAGSIGFLGHHVLVGLDPTHSITESATSVIGEVGRVLHCATVLADEIGFNPIRTLNDPIDSYAIDFRTAYGIQEAVPYHERGYIIQNVLIRITQHMLPIVYAHAVNHFTHDGIRRDEAGAEVLMGVHELQTLCSCYDVTLSQCLERHVHAVAADTAANPSPR